MAVGSEGDVTRARAMMAGPCANSTHMGPISTGQTTKLVDQVLCALHFQAVAEAGRLAEAGGVKAARIPAALAGGHRLRMPLTSAVAELHRLYVAAGFGKADNATIMRLVDGFQGNI